MPFFLENILAALAVVLAILVTLPAVSLFLLVLASGSRANDIGISIISPAMRVAVIVPAHNESIGVVPTIENLLPQLENGDRLLVVADNCSDDTAQHAHTAGASVIERFDTVRQGKGYALAFGVDALRSDPPDVVMVIDADCQVTGSGLRQVAAQSLSLGRVIQMLDLMVPYPESSLRTRILGFAWLIKNKVRPRGMQRMGQVCHLMGTGMAFPWDKIKDAQLATGHIAEDMKLGVDLTLSGMPPQFSEASCVISRFPEQSDVARTQKTRWEHGHLRIMREELPRLVKSALFKPSRATWILMMDLIIPPTSLYILLSSGFFFISWLMLFIFQSVICVTIFLISAVGLSILICALMVSWWRDGRQYVKFQELLAIPLYLIWKVPVYLSYIVRRNTRWIRTKRD